MCNDRIRVCHVYPRALEAAQYSVLASALSYRSIVVLALQFSSITRGTSRGPSHGALFTRPRTDSHSSESAEHLDVNTAAGIWTFPSPCCSSSVMFCLTFPRTRHRMISQFSQKSTSICHECKSLAAVFFINIFIYCLYYLISCFYSFHVGILFIYLYFFVIILGM